MAILWVRQSNRRNNGLSKTSVSYMAKGGEVADETSQLTLRWGDDPGFSRCPNVITRVILRGRERDIEGREPERWQHEQDLTRGCWLGRWRKGHKPRNVAAPRCWERQGHRFFPGALGRTTALLPWQFYPSEAMADLQLAEL